MKTIKTDFITVRFHNFNHIIRIGSIRDGGYFVTKKLVENSDFLISAGISYNAKFERDFKIINPNCKLIMIDGTYNFLLYLMRIFYWFFIKKSYTPKIPELIDMMCLKRESIFLKKFIGNHRNSIRLVDVFKNYISKGKGYLKMDIESSEYDLLDEILEYKDYFYGIAIEFHYVPNHLAEINSFICNIEKGLIGFNINDIGGISANGIPNSIELCFANYEFIHSTELDILTGKIFANDEKNELYVPTTIFNQIK